MDKLNIDTSFDDSEIVNDETNYKYLIEQHANKYATNIDIMTHNKNIYGFGMLNILCYHITQNSKYPFIQFMLEKMPFCNGIVSEKLILPLSTISTNNPEAFSNIITFKINTLLRKMGYDFCNITNTSYKGIISDSNERIYALVDISSIDILRLNISRNSPIWFALPTEIMNNKIICNIPIDDTVSELFLNMPELSLLYYKDNYDKTYPIPDAVYSGSHLKKVEWRSLFSMETDRVYQSCGEYYYFFRLFEDAVKEGGWVRQGGHKMIDLNDTNITHSKANVKLVDNEYGRYINGGINRYALFPENYSVYNESSAQFSLSDEDINIQFGHKKCILIQYNDETLDNILPDILVKEYESAYPISYHMLDKGILGDKYEIDNQDKYMIL